VRGWKSFRAGIWALALLGLAPVGRGQSATGFSGDTLPPRPNSDVVDNAGLFSRNPKGLKIITDRLSRLEQSEGFHIYLVTDSVIMGSNPVEMATRLQQGWLPEGNGFVIVYEVDSGSFGIGRPYDVVFKAGNDGGSQIPTFVAAEIIEHVSRQLDQEQKVQPMDSQVLLDRLSILLVSECQRYLEQGRAKTKNDQTMKVAGAMLGAIVLLAVVGFGAVRLMHRKERKNNRSYRFPPVPDQQRLGAPFGAKVSARRFAGADLPPPR